MIRLVLMLASAALLSGQTAPARYAEGQVWEYHTRPQDPGSLLKIQRIEQLDGDAVYHIAVSGIRIDAPGFQGALPHLPVSEGTLNASVTRRSAATIDLSLEETDEGIAEWRRAEGGVFTIPVSQIVDAVDTALQAPR